MLKQWLHISETTLTNHTNYFGQSNCTPIDIRIGRFRIDIK